MGHYYYYYYYYIIETFSTWRTPEAHHKIRIIAIIAFISIQSHVGVVAIRIKFVIVT